MLCVVAVVCCDCLVLGLSLRTEARGGDVPAVSKENKNPSLRMWAIMFTCIENYTDSHRNIQNTKL